MYLEGLRTPPFRHFACMQARSRLCPACVSRGGWPWSWWASLPHRCCSRARASASAPRTPGLTWTTRCLSSGCVAVPIGRGCGARTGGSLQAWAGAYGSMPVSAAHTGLRRAHLGRRLVRAAACQAAIALCRCSRGHELLQRKKEEGGREQHRSARCPTCSAPAPLRTRLRPLPRRSPG